MDKSELVDGEQYLFRFDYSENGLRYIGAFELGLYFADDNIFITKHTLEQVSADKVTIAIPLKEILGNAKA